VLQLHIGCAATYCARRMQYIACKQPAGAAALAGLLGVQSLRSPTAPVCQ
jgi:hypothetical protein